MLNYGISKVYHLLLHWRRFRLRIFLEGISVGLITGIVVVLFRFFIEQCEAFRNAVYVQMQTNHMIVFIWFILLLIISMLLGLIVKFEPLSSGSGIPQVKGTILRRLRMTWNKILACKFIGGILAIGFGLSLGREGPSIQLGAVIAQGFSRIMKRTRMEEVFLMTSGASAGLAAAFNAPLAGVIFALEELHKNFSPAVLMSSMAASITAALVAELCYGKNPIFNFTGLTILPFHYYGYLVLLGVITGLLGVLFNICLDKASDLYDHQNIVPKLFQTAIPLVIGGFIGFILPEILGGGNHLVSAIVAGRFSLIMLLILVTAKFAFTMISYGSGAPGGIFLPLLVIGALTGGAFSNILVHFTAIDPLYMNNFVVLAMAAFFTAIVKAPITGSILITEMTGSFNHLISLITISMTAYVVADLIKSKPVYDQLLERLLRKQDTLPAPKETKAQIIIELAVCIGSKLDRQKVRNIEWPVQSLLVSIKRGDKEIVPQGETIMLAGDFIYVLVNANQADGVRKLAAECN